MSMKFQDSQNLKGQISSENGFRKLSGKVLDFSDFQGVKNKGA